MKAADAAQQLGSAFPDLDLRGLRPLGTGWSHDTFECDAGLVFRFPRTPEVAQGLAREARLTDALQGALPVRVPHFEWRAEVEGRLVCGYRKLAGLPLVGEPGAHQSRGIAAFLSALHGFPRAEAESLLGAPPEWRAAYAGLRARSRDALAPLDARVALAFDTAVADFVSAWDGKLPVALVHGDLCRDHLLFSRSPARMIGAIDFEDAALGDPASDFAGLLLDFAERSVEAVLASYTGSVDGRLFERARFYARIAPVHEVLYGLRNAHEERITTGLARLRRSFGGDG
jgi:aminoglycoside phosphotransferase (APT) family kinase protein